MTEIMIVLKNINTDNQKCLGNAISAHPVPLSMTIAGNLPAIKL